MGGPITWGLPGPSNLWRWRTHYRSKRGSSRHVFLYDGRGGDIRIITLNEQLQQLRVEHRETVTAAKRLIQRRAR